MVKETYRGIALMISQAVDFAFFSLDFGLTRHSKREQYIIPF